jgi:UDP-glucuronate decarboxylase
MVDGLIRMMTCEDFVGPVNLGNPREFSIRRLAEHVLEITGSASEIVYKPLPQDDPVQRCPDISLAKEKLNWVPQVGLAEGLEKAIDYFRKVMK